MRATLSLIIIALWIAAIVGWVWNIVKLFSLDFGTEFALRVLGIFIAFIGAIYGYF